jgi:hypothetical protein
VEAPASWSGTGRCGPLPHPSPAPRAPHAPRAPRQCAREPETVSLVLELTAADGRRPIPPAAEGPLVRSAVAAALEIPEEWVRPPPAPAPINCARRWNDAPARG